MQQKKNGIFELDIDPFWQAGVVVGAILLFCFFSWVFDKMAVFTVASYFPWTVSASLTLLYAVGSSVLSLGATDPNKYWGRSISAYVVVVVVGGAIASLFSGMTVFEAKSFAWIYIVFSMGYVLFLIFLRAMRKIVEIAEKQDRRLRGEE